LNVLLHENEACLLISSLPPETRLNLPSFFTDLREGSSSTFANLFQGLSAVVRALPLRSSANSLRRAPRLSVTMSSTFEADEK